MRATFETVGRVWAASGRPPELVRLAVRASLAAHDLDLQIEHTGTGSFRVTVTEFSGEVVVQEITLTIDFDEIEERLRLGILVLWTGSILLDAERWRRRHDVAVVVALRTARERLGLPGDGG